MASKKHISSDKITIFSYFIAVILIGAFLLVLPFSWNREGSISFLSALFTATSATCVTGLIVVDTAGYSLFGQIVIILLIQAGGLGIVTFATLYVTTPRKRISLVNRGIIKDMFIDEVESNPKNIIINIVSKTVFIEGFGALILYFRFKAIDPQIPAFTAIFHAISAFCNAGFSTFSEGLIKFSSDWIVNSVIMVLIVLGGIGFVVMRDIESVFMREKRHLTYHTRMIILITLALLIVPAVVFFFAEYNNAFKDLPLNQKILSSLFESVTVRTAGFENISQASFGFLSLTFILVLMFIGGSPGSTAGGVKTSTVFVAVVSSFKEREDDGSVCFKRGALSVETIAKAFSVLGKAIVIVFIELVLLCLFEGNRFPFIDILYEALSAFGTVGLTRGITSSLTWMSKLVLIATMFIGRVGLFAMAIPKSRYSVERYSDFPHENLLIG